MSLKRFELKKELIIEVSAIAKKKVVKYVVKFYSKFSENCSQQLCDDVKVLDNRMIPPSKTKFLKFGFF